MRQADAGGIGIGGGGIFQPFAHILGGMQGGTDVVGEKREGICDLLLHLGILVKQVTDAVGAGAGEQILVAVLQGADQKRLDPAAQGGKGLPLVGEIAHNDAGHGGGADRSGIAEALEAPAAARAHDGTDDGAGAVTGSGVNDQVAGIAVRSILDAEENGKVVVGYGLHEFLTADGGHLCAAQKDGIGFDTPEQAVDEQPFLRKLPRGMLRNGALGIFDHGKCPPLI